METLVLARLQVPAQTLLLYEQMTMNDPDRTGNWRYYIRDDGCVFNARNTQLFVTDPAQFKRDDPALFWNTLFKTTPDRCFIAQQQSALLDAIKVTDIASLKPYYTSSQRISSPSIERWTFEQAGHAYTIVVEQGGEPSELATLKTKINDLIGQAPRPT